MVIPGTKIALALSGGNALGSWQAGAFEAMAARGLTVHRVVGASAGAINGGMIAGNSAAVAIERLRAFWSPARAEAAYWWPAHIDGWRRSASALGTLLGGRPEAFRPRALFEHWLSDPGATSLFDTDPLGATLAASIDWARLNDGAMRFQATAVDLETGEDALFDTARGPLTPDHIRASAALLPAFPSVEIDGRRYVDPGLSANLPLDALLSDPGPEPLLIIALDLLPLAAPLPRTIGQSAERLQDLIFARQARRTIDAWRAIYDLHGAQAPAVTLAQLNYVDQDREVAGKAFDFSRESAAERWASGHAAAGRLLDAVAAAPIHTGTAGLTVIDGQTGKELPSGAFGLAAR